MKCSGCGRDVKRKERVGEECPHCRTVFIFSPATDGISDAQFLALLEKVSGGGEVKWTADHLYYELCRKECRPGAFKKAWLALGRLFGGDGVVEASIGPERSNELLRRWTAVRGRPAGLITKAPGARDVKRSAAQEEELGAYSFDRAVITDRQETVDVLLANRFHFENNCAVLTAGGYPAAAFELVRRMLRNNPRISIFVVHDCSVSGNGLARRLAEDPDWFGGKAVRIVDVGLRVEHTSAFNGLIRPANHDRSMGAPARTAEERWLAAHRLELAAIRPEQLIKRLFRAITETEARPETDSGTVIWTGGDGGGVTSFGTDASAGDGGADSFG